MKKITLTLLLIVLIASSSFATHNRSAYIYVKSLGGDCLLDSVYIITYTRTSAPADRQSLPLNYGDGTTDTVQRSSKYSLDLNLYPDVSINIYPTTHHFPGAGTYKLTMFDQNRNAGVINIPGSVNIPIFVSTTITIDPAIGCDNSPEVLNQPIEVGCVGEPFIYNPNAYDPDGDSLSYELIPCRGAGVNGDQNIVGFYEPTGTTSFSLDPVTGDLKWLNPRFNNSNPIDSGQWNVAILILEWRKNPRTGEYMNIGNVTVDMQITIHTCTNVPPKVIIPPDTCVLAGSRIRFDVTASDVYFFPIDLYATGGPFEVSNPATFPQGISNSGNVTGIFNWLTDCNNIQRLPYTVTFKAIDLDLLDLPPVDLTGLATMNITVISPAPKNLVDTPMGNTIYMHWNPDICSNAIGYKIYRKNGFYSDSIQCPCTVGVPASTGFTFIAEVLGINDTTFTDDNNGLGLNHGIKYCYFVTAIFQDSSESCASNQACAQLKKDSPIITNVSIDSTDVTAGRIFVAWSMPTELDTNNSFRPPYQYKIYRSGGFTGSNLILVGTSNLSDTLSFTDTTFVDSFSPPINTLDSANSYRVDLYADDTLVNKSTVASSNYLTIAVSNHTLNLSWQEQVGWSDTLFVVYRKDTLTHLWDSIGSTSNNSYSDNNLPFHKQQLYYVKSIGHYTGSGYVYPIIDSSEIMSATPLDNIPPCSPIGTSINADCVFHNDFLTWNNPNNSCSNYVAGYNIYYSPTNNNNFELLTTLTPATDTSYLYSNTHSIAGCFMVTAIDSGGLESKNPLQICVDNCPEYTLPNIFSPNGDGINDIFHPFPYSYIRDIDIKIFDRWGLLVFQTSDPDINWDGKNGFSHKALTDGVYYYICKVNAIHYDGVRTTTLKGFIEIITDK